MQIHLWDEIKPANNSGPEELVFHLWTTEKKWKQKICLNYCIDLNTQSLACRPNLAHRAISSSPGASPKVWKISSWGAGLLPCRQISGPLRSPMGQIMWPRALDHTGAWLGQCAGSSCVRLGPGQGDRAGIQLDSAHGGELTHGVAPTDPLHVLTWHGIQPMDWAPCHSSKLWPVAPLVQTTYSET